MPTQLKNIFPILILGVSLSVQANVFPTRDAKSYFKKSYEESRFQFLETTETYKKLNTYEITAESFADPEDSTLTTNLAWFRNPSKTPASNLVVVMSGLHGIEGYVGSALQTAMIENMLPPQPGATDFLFIHALNPYGFKNNRRVNRNNIDLNRNFVLNETDYKQQNKAYGEINWFLNPQEPVQLEFFSRLSFIASSIKLIFRYSLETLREAILKGQYEFDKGLYYGGQNYQYQKAFIDKMASTYFPKYKTVFTLDLHTGYGEKNKLHILANSMNQPTAPQLNKIFGGEDRIDYGDKKKFYRTTGDLITYLQSKSTPETQVLGATFEFGTLNSQKTLGSIESLRRMVLENQDQHNKKNTETTDEVNLLFQDMFYPQDPEFQSLVLIQGRSEFNRIKNYFK